MIRKKTNIFAEDRPVELKARSIILAIILTILLALSNSYLALKLGILTSASIPAAIISMGILRFFKNSSILENNIVQTAASAGEAIAGGIVYTIPALIIIGYWDHFDYLTNFIIAASGGILGVLFSIPLRRTLVNDSSLKFPEGQAIAEILKSRSNQAGIKEIFLGGVVGGFLELCQMGFKIIASGWSFWFIIKRSLVGFGLGFSATMIGAGYLIGPEMALSIFVGAIISWFIAMPFTSQFYPEITLHNPPMLASSLIWNSELRYLGIGAMLFAGILTFLRLIKPLAKNIGLSFSTRIANPRPKLIQPYDQDIPLPFIFAGISLVSIVLFLAFRFYFPIQQTGLDAHLSSILALGSVFYVLIIGFLFSVITAYLSGMVGVTASPGSSVIIAGMLFAAWLLLTLVVHYVPLPLTEAEIRAAEAITIIIGSVVTGIAAIANDNTQDLKVGQLVGATPWKQEVMLLLGVIISSLVIPPVMQLLFNVYGIAGVMPHAGMDVSQSLPAPTAALMATITEAVFRHTLPWSLMLEGVGIILILSLLNSFLDRKLSYRLSLLGVSIGMYLPIASSLPLFFGGSIAFYIKRKLAKNSKSKEKIKSRYEVGVLIACGLVAGSALMDIFLAIPFSIFHSPNALSLTTENFEPFAVILGIVTTLGLAWWIKSRVLI